MSFFNTKQVETLRISPTQYLEIGIETSLLYYIIDPGEPLDIASIEYKIDKLTGRDTENIIPWTSVVIAGVTDSVYQMGVTLTSIEPADNIQLTLKVTDADGIEYYHIDTEVTPI